MLQANTLVRLAAGMSVFGLVACGGPKTESGVSYKAKSASDVQQACVSMQEADPFIMNIQTTKRIRSKAIDSCCKEAKKNAADLSPKQRVFLWNQWMAFDNISQTPNEVKAYREVENAVAGDLTTKERIDAAAIKPLAAQCTRRTIEERS